MNDATPVDPNAAALAALTISAHLLKSLVTKNIMTGEEVEQMLRGIVADLGGTDEVTKANCRHAIQAVFPRLNLV